MCLKLLKLMEYNQIENNNQRMIKFDTSCDLMFLPFLWNTQLYTFDRRE